MAARPRALQNRKFPTSLPEREVLTISQPVDAELAF
jgi:hypothetical protein